MPKQNKKLRVAMPAWEIGRVSSGLGVKIGGLGVIVEELPLELVKAAARQNIDLEIETLTPCFAHYDKSQLTKLDLHLPVTLEGHTFEFDVYEHVFPDGRLPFQERLQHAFCPSHVCRSEQYFLYGQGSCLQRNL